MLLDAHLAQPAVLEYLADAFAAVGRPAAGSRLIIVCHHTAQLPLALQRVARRIYCSAPRALADVAMTTLQMMGDALDSCSRHVQRLIYSVVFAHALLSARRVAVDGPWDSGANYGVIASIGAALSLQSATSHSHMHSLYEHARWQLCHVRECASFRVVTRSFLLCVHRGRTCSANLLHWLKPHARCA